MYLKDENKLFDGFMKMQLLLKCLILKKINKEAGVAENYRQAINGDNAPMNFKKDLTSI